MELSVTVLEAPVSSGFQRCVRSCGLAPASSLPLGRRFLRYIVQVDEIVAMFFFAKISGSWGFVRDQDTHEVATARRRSKATRCKRTPEKCLARRWESAESCMDRIPDDDQNFFFMLDACAEALGARLKRAQAEDKELLSKGAPDSDNLDPAAEEYEVWEIRTNRVAKVSLSVMNEKKKKVFVS